jgi:hypothetical protein
VILDVFGLGLPVFDLGLVVFGEFEVSIWMFLQYLGSDLECFWLGLGHFLDV